MSAESVIGMISANGLPSRNDRHRALHYEGCDPVRLLRLRKCLRNRREAVTLNKLVKHPGIYDCARVHLCQPPFNFLDKCAVRDAVPIHNGNSYIVIAPGGTKLNNKIIRMNDSSDKRYIRSQILRESFLRSAHDFFIIRC